MKNKIYIKQTRQILGAGLFLLVSGCNMGNGVHKSLDFLYGEATLLNNDV